MSTFEAWPKIPRWNREVVVTEKIDGTNGAIIIEDLTVESAGSPHLLHTQIVLEQLDEEHSLCRSYGVFAQSRNRMLRPGVGREAGNDNYGFAAWVQENAAELVKLLGPGRHFGEWYGKGIARGYGLDHRRFALFNTNRWTKEDLALAKTSLPVDVVPVLGVLARPSEETEWTGGDTELDYLECDLRCLGSRLVPGFMRPEGLILYHTAARQYFKVLLEGDELPKGVIPRSEREPVAV